MIWALLHHRVRGGVYVELGMVFIGGWGYLTIYCLRARNGVLVLEDCPRAQGQLEDPKSWPLPSGLALASMHRPPVTGLKLMCSICSTITGMQCGED